MTSDPQADVCLQIRISLTTELQTKSNIAVPDLQEEQVIWIPRE